MSDDAQNQENHTVRHMASIKSALDKAPEGPKKTKSQQHYKAAEAAHEADNDDEAHKQLKEAGRALS